jgi:hypothetical protein
VGKSNDEEEKEVKLLNAEPKISLKKLETKTHTLMKFI